MRRLAHRFIVPVLVVLAAPVAGTLPLVAQNAHPTARPEAVGFAPTHILSDGGSGEWINNENGIVNLAMPIGGTFAVGPQLSYQLLLTYASSIWEVKSIGGSAFSRLRWDGPFGVGFSLHLGRIEAFQGQSNLEYEYVSPDGSRHRIGTNNQLSTTGNVIETTLDGTYIRVERFQDGNPSPQYPLAFPSTWILHFPDGTAAKFDGDGTSGPNYHLIEMWAIAQVPDSTTLLDHDAWVRVTYDPEDSLDGRPPCIGLIEDSLGRQVTFENEPTVNNGCRTAGITQPAHAGGAATTATWSFDYYPLMSIHPPDDPSSPVADRSLLRSVTLPGPAGAEPVLEFDYLDPDLTTGTVTDGILRQRFLPRQADEPRNATGDAYYEYEYAPNEFLVWSFEGPVGQKSWGLAPHEGRAVVEKTLHMQGASHSWAWSRTYDVRKSPTEVDHIDPDGNLTVYHFEPTEAAPADDWDDGLPIRTEWYAGSNPATRTLLRSEDLEYSVGFFYYGPPHLLENLEVKTRTATEEGVTVVTRRLGIDGYGRPSDVVVEAAGAGLYRRTHTDWVAPGAGDPWVLGRWSRRTLHDELGRPVATQDAVFSATGLLQSLTLRADPTGAASTDDVITTQDYDVDGTGEGWGLLMATAVSGGDGGHGYATGYEYQDHTYLARVRTLPSGAAPPAGEPDPALPTSWFPLNRDFDPGTGLPLRSLDPNDENPATAPTPPDGHPSATDSTFSYDTTYAWDALGRPTAIRPAGTAATTIRYPDLWTTEVKQCVTEPGDCRTSFQKRDRRGRLVEERVSDAAGGFNGRRTVYDWAGRVLRQSEWFPCDEPLAEDCDPPSPPLAETVFDYIRTTADGKPDPFGRPWKVTASDGAVTTFTYAGPVRTAKVKVNNNHPDGSVTVLEPETRWFYDAFGRLVAVDAPEGADAAYRYDAADRLVRAELVDATTGTTQVRSFAFDALGRLRSSTTPEGGTVQVLLYDPSGKPLETRDARGRTFRTLYDDAGRVQEVREVRDTTEFVLARNGYDGGNCFGFLPHPACGKLTLSEAFDEWGLPVAKTAFDYLDGVGRLSAQKTTFAAWFGFADTYEGFEPAVRIDYFYDGWGELKDLGYPTPWGTDRFSNGIAYLRYNRSNGWLESIEDLNRGTTLLTVDQFNAAGGFRTWTTGNGVETNLLPDLRFRPSRITVTGPGGELWTSGDYLYDDAGNILAMGTDTFEYDALSRLTNAQIYFDADAVPGAELHQEQYGFDGFGNMTRRDPAGPEIMDLTVDLRTNRIDSVTQAAWPLEWDPAGNLVLDPTMFLASQQGVLRFDGRGRLGGIARRGTGLPTVWAEQFAYDSGGLRLMRTEEGTGRTTFYLRDVSGQVLSEFERSAESDIAPSWSRDTFYGPMGVIGVAAAQKPAAPGGLRPAVSNIEGSYQVALSWKPPGPGETVTGYNVYRYDLAAGVWQSQESVSGSVYTWSQTGVSAGSYYYHVRAVNASGEGEWSNVVKVTPAALSPPAVSGLVAKALEDVIRLTWDRVTDFDLIFMSTVFYQYRVERRLAGTQDPWAELTTLPLQEPAFVDPDPVEGVSYEYQVTVVDTSGQSSSPQTTVEATSADPFRPPPPGGVFASSGPAALEASLGWDASLEDDVIGYRIYRWNGTTWVLQTGAGQDFFYSDGVTDWVLVPAGDDTIPATATRAKLADLTEGVPLWLAVVAVDSGGVGGAARESDRSEPVTVLPARSSPELEVPGGTRLTRTKAHLTPPIATPAGAYSFHYYRRLEGEPGLFELRNGTPASSYDDDGLDPCRAYVYLATQTPVTTLDGVPLSTGEESAQSGAVWVDRYAVANEPKRVMVPGSQWLTWGWNGLADCPEETADYAVMGYTLSRQTSGGTVIIGTVEDEAANIEDDTADPGQFYWYGVKARLWDKHELKYTSSPWGYAVCVSGVGVEQPDSACAWGTPPPTGGGGEFPTEPPLQPKKYKISDPHVELRGPESITDEDWQLACMAEPEAPVSTGMVPPPDAALGHPTRTRAVATALAASEVPVAQPAALDPAVMAVFGSRIPGPFGAIQAADGLWESPVEFIGAPPMAGSPGARLWTLTYLHADHLGTTRLGTDEDGAREFKSASMPFGELLSASGDSMQAPKHFSGHARDSGSAVYMMARSYSIALARFASSDPISGTAEDPASYHRYAYVSGNPVKYVDPSGMRQSLVHPDEEDLRQQFLGFGPLGQETLPRRPNQGPCYLCDGSVDETKSGDDSANDENGDTTDTAEDDGGVVYDAVGLALALLSWDGNKTRVIAEAWTEVANVPGPWGSERAAHHGGWNDPGASLEGGWATAYEWSYKTAGASAVGALALGGAGAAGLSAFGRFGPSWHFGIQRAGNLNVVHIGRHVKYGVHVAFGAAKPYAARVHVYAQRAWPFYRIWP